MPSSDWSIEKRRYQRRSAIAMAIYVVTIFAVSWVMRHPPSGPVRYLLAVLPALPLLAVIVALGRYVAEERDEYQRALVVRHIMWGTGATLAITTVWGFLEIYADVPHLQVFWVAVMWLFFFGAASCVTRITDR